MDMIKRLIIFVISTIAAYIMQQYLPSILNYIDNIPNLPVILGMKPRYYLAVLLFMVLYEYYKRLRGKGYLVDLLNSRIEEMKSGPMSKCFIEFVTQDSIDIARHFKLITAQPIDLAWEPKLIGLKSCKRDDCDSWKRDNISKSLSTLRRQRMIFISTSLIGWQTNICYAMECHLFNIINDKKKFENDTDYRNKQISKLHTKTRFGCIRKLDCRRIVIIHKKEWDIIKTTRDYRNRMEKYLKWHFDHNWNMKLYVVNDEIEIKLSILGNMIIGYDELTDFVIIVNHNKEEVVFAQNDKEMAQIIKDNNTSINYKEWYDNAWRGLHCDVIENQIIDKNYIDILY